MGFSPFDGKELDTTEQLSIHNIYICIHNVCMFTNIIVYCSVCIYTYIHTHIYNCVLKYILYTP